MLKMLLMIGLMIAAALPTQAQDKCATEEADPLAYFMHEAGLRQGKGQYDRALAAYDCALALMPDSPLILLNRGSAFYASGNFEGALNDYTRYTTLVPEDPVGHINVGWAYFKLEAYSSALESYDRAQALTPDYAAIYNNRGVTYMAQGRIEQARADFEKAIELDYEPRFSPYHNLGLLYIGRNYPEAMHFLNKAAALNPEDAETIRLLAEAQYELGLYDQAIQTYQQYAQLAGRFARPELVQRLSMLETRASLIRFSPLLAIVLIGLYALVYRLWRRRRLSQQVPPPALESAPPIITAEPVREAVPAQNRVPRWTALLALPVIGALLLGVGRLLNRAGQPADT